MSLVALPLRAVAAVLTLVALACAFGIFMLDGLADRMVR